MRKLLMFLGAGSLLFLGYTHAQADAIVEDTADAVYQRAAASNTNFAGPARDRRNEFQGGGDGAAGEGAAGDAGASAGNGGAGAAGGNGCSR